MVIMVGLGLELGLGLGGLGLYTGFSGTVVYSAE